MKKIILKIKLVVSIVFIGVISNLNTYSALENKEISNTENCTNAKPSITYISQIKGRPGYNESDWKNKLNIGSSEGCAVASACMSLSSIGINILPGVAINNLGGVNVIWNKLYGNCGKKIACDIKISLEEALKRYDENSKNYAPPVVKVGRPHWAVVISGKNGKYVTLDPAYGKDKIYTLSKNVVVRQYYLKKE